MKIAIASGKGGTGKTFLSTNLFWIAAQRKIDVEIIDCDSEEPNVSEFLNGKLISQETVSQNIPIIDSTKCVFCGKCYDYCGYNAIVYLPMGGFIEVVNDLCHDCGACSLMCESGAITELPKRLGLITSYQVANNAIMTELKADVGVYTPVPILKKALKHLSNTKLTILDSPPGISCPFIATAEEADYIVLVTEPTPFGLNDLKLTVETLKELKKPFGIIINRAGLGDNAIYEYLSKEKIVLLNQIPFDRKIAAIYTQGKLVAMENSDYRTLFEQILDTIMSEPNCITPNHQTE